MLINIAQFLKEDIWILTDQQRPFIQCFGIKALRICLLAAQGFKRDLCQLRASALTLYTLLSIVPIIALLFGIAKGFGFEKKLEQQLLDQASDQDTMMLQLIEFSQNMLSSTKGGVVAGIGIIVLFFTVIKVIGNIEESFNQIWKIKKNRSINRKLSDYLSLMMLAPVLLIVSSSITIFVKTQITWLVKVIHLPEFGTKMVLYAMSFSPLLIMVLLFTFIFLFMPNQKIKFRAGLIAGICTGIMYQIVQWAYLTLQIGVSSYNAIYGSFAALPLFLIWLQIVWVVVLFGCEISFYLQNYDSYQHNEKFVNLSNALKKMIALKVCHNIVMHFANAEKAPNPEQIAAEVQLPISVVRRILELLLECQLIVEIKTLEDEPVCYQPAHDINKLTFASVVAALETCGQNTVPGMDDKDKFYHLDSINTKQLLKDL